MGHLRSGVQDQPDQHSETLSLLKTKKKIAEWGGEHLYSQLFRRLRWENYLSTGVWGCSELASPHCTLACVQHKTLSLRKKFKNNSYSLWKKTQESFYLRWQRNSVLWKIKIKYNLWKNLKNFWLASRRQPDTLISRAKFLKEGKDTRTRILFYCLGWKYLLDVISSLIWRHWFGHLLPKIIVLEDT